jgi:predicted unusual protein kinase regulating ubiquinone biosynthesis (AarF/ABC1/UbiB family)
MNKAFEEFEPAPIAAASLGQVHRATLRGGRRVAVKVQRPDIRERIVEDLEALRELAAFLDRHSSLGERYELAKTVETFGNSLLAELDYRREAQNLIVLRKNLEGFERIYVPRPVDDYSTSRVLTMEYVDGRKVTDIDPMTRSTSTAPRSRASSSTRICTRSSSTASSMPIRTRATCSSPRTGGSRCSTSA